MTDQADEGNPVLELNVAGVVGEPGEPLGKEAGGNAGGVEEGIDEGFSRVVRNGDDVMAEVSGSEVLVGCGPTDAASNGLSNVLPRDRDGPSLDRHEESREGRVDEKGGDKGKIDEGEILEEEVSRVESGSVNDVAGGAVKTGSMCGGDRRESFEGRATAIEVGAVDSTVIGDNIAEEKGGSELVVSQKELFTDGKSSNSEKFRVVSSDAKEDHIPNADVVCGDTENDVAITSAKSLEEEIDAVSGDEGHVMKDASCIQNMKVIESHHSDENVANSGERNLENIVEVCGDPTNTDASSNVTLLSCQKTEEAPDGAAVVGEENVSGDIEADMLVCNNNQDEQISRLVTDETKLKPGESETNVERHPVETDAVMVEPANDEIKLKSVETEANLDEHVVGTDAVMVDFRHEDASESLPVLYSVIHEHEGAGVEVHIHSESNAGAFTYVNEDTIGDDDRTAAGSIPTKTETTDELTGSVDAEIGGRDNDIYSGRRNGGIEAVEDQQPCMWEEKETMEGSKSDLNREEEEVTDLTHADPNSPTMEVDEASVPNDSDLHGDDMEVDEQYDGAENREIVEEKEESGGELKPESSRGVDEAVYQLPPDAENVFSVSDLVWGKVRSHPWWPGQIFDPSDASEKAMKYHKKDSFLVAYFGDRTFAWNEASLLKPFRSYFSNAVRQSSSEGFENAVECALEEVSRRVELGLACSCLSKDILDEIKVQVVENAGIRPDACTREGVDKSADADSFKPNEFLQYIRTLAQCPSAGADRLEIVIAKVQLLAIYRRKGFNQLPEFQSCGDLEDDAEALDSKDHIHVRDVKDGITSSGQESLDVPKGSSHRRKHNLKDIVYHRRRERNLFELMDEAMIYSEDDEFELDGSLSAKRRKGIDTSNDSNILDERKNISIAKVVSTSSSLPKPSFKIGECISRVASQMTRSPSIKSQSEGFGRIESATVNDDPDRAKMSIAAEYSSLEDLLSQLQTVAASPMGGYSFLNVIVCFFSDFRNSTAVGLDSSLGRVGGKRKKSSQYAGGSSEAFEFEDMNDSYWTDRIIGNGFEENPDGVVHGENQLISFEQEKPRKASRRSYTRRQDLEISDPSPEKPVGYMGPNSPAELVLTFPEPRFIPSEVSLNKTFKRFGPLNELQTELDRDGNRARVVFKKCCDAEVACNSASKFKIFGSVVVNYQLNYTLTEPFTTYYKPVPLPEGPEDAN